MSTRSIGHHSTRHAATILVGGNAAIVRQSVAEDIPLDPRVLLDVVDYATTTFRFSDLPVPT